MLVAFGTSDPDCGDNFTAEVQQKLFSSRLYHKSFSYLALSNHGWHTDYHRGKTEQS